MYHSFKAIERFPPWHIVEKHMPDTFRKEYPNTRLIIDATELQVERPSSLLTQSCTFSAYKNRNTVKVLIGILPSGVIAFVSPTYVTVSGKTSLIAHLKVSRNVGFKYSVCRSWPMVVARGGWKRCSKILR